VHKRRFASARPTHDGKKTRNRERQIHSIESDALAQFDLEIVDRENGGSVNPQPFTRVILPFSFGFRGGLQFSDNPNSRDVPVKMMQLSLYGGYARKQASEKR
jgi:hypothetical protein